MNSKNTALLIIDPVNSCAHEDCEDPKWGITYNQIRKMMPRLDRFIGKIRKLKNLPIIWVNIIKWQEKYLTDNLNELYSDPRVSYYSDDNTGFSEEFYQVKPEKNEPIFTKNHPDAFVNHEFKNYLKDRGIKYLVVTGIFTDGCVLSTIVSGFSRGFNFVILKDLVETTDVPKRQELQKLLLSYTFPFMYGKTVNSSDFLKNWKK